MLRVISIRRCTPAGFKLTKLFGIDDFSAAKDFGKVFIIYYLLTESEVITGKSQTEALMY